jgi:hypothetical protein
MLIEQGRYIYAPTHRRALVGRSALHRVLDTFFEGSLEKAVAALLQGCDAKLSRRSSSDWSNSFRRLANKGANMSAFLALDLSPLLSDLAIKSLFIMLLALIAVGLLQRASAAWRHLAWGLGVTGLLLLPVLSLVLPGWRVSWLPQ